MLNPYDFQMTSSTEYDDEKPAPCEEFDHLRYCSTPGEPHNHLLIQEQHLISHDQEQEQQEQPPPPQHQPSYLHIKPTMESMHLTKGEQTNNNLHQVGQLS